MSTVQLAVYRGLTTAMSTELNALPVATTTTGRAVSAAIDNSSNLDLFDVLELTVTFATAPTAGTLVEVYLLISIDGGTTYSDGSASVEPQSSLFVGGFTVRAVNTIQRLHLRDVPMQPGLFKYLVKNTTNQPFPATGTTLERNPYQLQSV